MMSKCVLSAVLPAVAVTLQLRIRSELLESRPSPGGAPSPHTDASGSLPPHTRPLCLLAIRVRRTALPARDVCS